MIDFALKVIGAAPRGGGGGGVYWVAFVAPECCSIVFDSMGGFERLERLFILDCFLFFGLRALGGFVLDCFCCP